MNMGVSLVFRAFMDDNSEFNAAMSSDDPTRIGKETGNYMKAFFAVEIPVADLEKGENYEKASSLVLGLI